MLWSEQYPKLKYEYGKEMQEKDGCDLNGLKLQDMLNLFLLRVNKDVLNSNRSGTKIILLQLCFYYLEVETILKKLLIY